MIKKITTLIFIGFFTLVVLYLIIIMLDSEKPSLTHLKCNKMIVDCDSCQISKNIITDSKTIDSLNILLSNFCTPYVGSGNYSKMKPKAIINFKCYYESDLKTNIIIFIDQDYNYSISINEINKSRFFKAPEFLIEDYNNSIFFKEFLKRNFYIN